MKRTEVEAVLAAVRSIASELPAAEQYVMVHHPAFRVGKKPFVVVGMQVEADAATVSINLGREVQHELLGDPRFHKTPYMHQNGWVTIAYDALAPGELAALTEESWRRIANKKQLAERAAKTSTGAAARTKGRAAAEQQVGPAKSPRKVAKRA